jgi:hypothetical protein
MEFLVSGLVGAVLVFIFQAGIEAWRNRREKRGILRLVLAEVEHNLEVTKTIGERKPDLLGSADFLRSMKTETWLDARKDAARLCPAYLTKVLNTYYSPLQTLLTLLQFEKSADRRFREGISKRQPQSTVSATRNPYDSYLNDVLRTQKEAQKQIEEHLKTSWWVRS